MKNNPKIIKIDFKKLRLNLEIQKKKKKWQISFTNYIFILFNFDPFSKNYA